MTITHIPLSYSLPHTYKLIVSIFNFGGFSSVQLYNIWQTFSNSCIPVCFHLHCEEVFIPPNPANMWYFQYASF